MATIDNNNRILSGLRADIMRNLMENKNLLNKKGMIYVGTGIIDTLGGETVYRTTALELGTEGQLLKNINGSLAYAKLANDNLDSTTNYSNLTTTFQNFSLLPSQISGSFSSLRINKENFSSDQSYLNLLHYSGDNIIGPWGCSLSLGLNENKYFGIRLKSPVVPIMRYSVIFTGVASEDIGFTGGTLIFNHIMRKGTYSIYAVLKDYVDQSGAIVSESGLNWAGWCLPSCIEGSPGVLHMAHREPLKIEVKDNGTSDLECNIYMYDDAAGVLRKLTYSGKSFYSSGSQIF